MHTLGRVERQCNRLSHVGVGRGGRECRDGCCGLTWLNGRPLMVRVARSCASGALGHEGVMWAATMTSRASSVRLSHGFVAHSSGPMAWMRATRRPRRWRGRGRSGTRCRRWRTRPATCSGLADRSRGCGRPPGWLQWRRWIFPMSSLGSSRPFSGFRPASAQRSGSSMRVSGGLRRLRRRWASVHRRSALTSVEGSISSGRSWR